MFSRTKKWLGRPVYKGDPPSNGMMLGALVFGFIFDTVWDWMLP